MSKVLTLNDKIVVASNGKAILSPNAGSGGYVTQDENGYIILPPDGGGSSDTWAWYGTDAELIDTTTQTVALKDTSFATWTPSTTSTMIYTLPTNSISTNFSDYDYVCVGEFVFDPVYESGTTLQTITKQIETRWEVRSIVPSNVASWDSETYNTQDNSCNFTYPRIFYINSSGTSQIYNGSSYGLYVGWGNGTSSGMNSFQKTPSVYARCYSNFFTTTVAAAVDQTNSKFKISFSVYRIPASKSVARSVTAITMDMYQNGTS
jgi:hypothetical protein